MCTILMILGQICTVDQTVSYFLYTTIEYTEKTYVIIGGYVSSNYIHR